MEKKLKVKFQKILGSPVFPPGVYVAGQKFERLEGDAVSRRGSLFSLVTLNGPKDFDAPVFGQAIFDTLEEEYFADSHLPPLPALEKAAFSSHRRLVGMALSAHLGQSVDFNLILAVLWGQVLYLCRLGNAVVYLLRDGKVSEVSLGDETLVTCASGFVYSGDTLILGSKDFKTHFSAEALEGNLLKLEEKMQSLGESNTLAALVLKIEIEEYPNEKELIEFVPPVRPGQPRFVRRLPNWPPVWPGRSLKKMMPSVVVLIIFSVFAFSVYWTISRQANLRLTSLSQKTYAQVDLDLVGAADLVLLNDSKAAEILNKSLKSLQDLEKFGLKEGKLDQYLSQTRSLLAKVSKETPVEKPNLVYDFALVAKNIKPTNLAGSRSNLFVGDVSGGGVYRLKINSPSETQKIDAEKISSPIKISAFDDSVFVLTKDGVSVVNNRTQEVSVSVVPALASLRIFDFQSYNSNLYFLDVSGSQILRSVYGQSGYGKMANWLKEEADLSQALNFSLNGSVYVLRSDGRVLKFEAGKLVDFSLSGYSKTLGKETFIYTTSGLDDVLLVDRAGRKIVRFSEKGVYQKTYDLSGSAVTSLDSLYVSPESLNLYLLSGTKVYEVKP